MQAICRENGSCCINVGAVHAYIHALTTWGENELPSCHWKIKIVQNNKWWITHVKSSTIEKKPGINGGCRHYPALNIVPVVAIELCFFSYAWGYIDFSLWLSFPQTQEEEKQLQTDARKAQVPPPKTGSKNRHTWRDGSRRGHAAKISTAEGVTWTCWAKSSSFQVARLPKGGHLFLALRVFFFFFWSFSISIRSLHLQRPWKRMSNSSISACVCVFVLDLTYFWCTDIRLAFQLQKYPRSQSHVDPLLKCYEPS